MKRLRQHTTVVLFLLPAIAATIGSLVVLIAVTGDVRTAGPGTMLYSLRRSALLIERALTSDPLERAEITALLEQPDQYRTTNLERQPLDVEPATATARIIPVLPTSTYVPSPTRRSEPIIVVGTATRAPEQVLPAGSDQLVTGNAPDAPTANVPTAAIPLPANPPEGQDEPAVAVVPVAPVFVPVATEAPQGAIGEAPEAANRQPSVSVPPPPTETTAPRVEAVSNDDEPEVEPAKEIEPTRTPKPEDIEDPTQVPEPDEAPEPTEVEEVRPPREPEPDEAPEPTDAPEPPEAPEPTKVEDDRRGSDSPETPPEPPKVEEDDDAVEEPEPPETDDD